MNVALQGGPSLGAVSYNCPLLNVLLELGLFGADKIVGLPAKLAFDFNLSHHVTFELEINFIFIS